MKYSSFRLLLPIVLLFAGGAVHAQYVWLNEQGVKQFSDMPPPADVPKNRILKQPSTAASRISTEETAPDGSKEAQQPLTTADKNADFQKRRAEQAEQQKKSQDEAKRKAQKTANCEKARNYSKALDSGERITNTDKNGERSFMSDEQRARESRETRDILKDCK